MLLFSWSLCHHRQEIERGGHSGVVGMTTASVNRTVNRLPVSQRWKKDTYINMTILRAGPSIIDLAFLAPCISSQFEFRKWIGVPRNSFIPNEVHLKTNRKLTQLSTVWNNTDRCNAECVIMCYDHNSWQLFLDTVSNQSTLVWEINSTAFQKQF